MSYVARISIIAPDGADTTGVERAVAALQNALGTDWTVHLAVKGKGKGAGGPKGLAIQQAHAEHPDWTRKQIAEHVGCAISRVSEVYAALGLTARNASEAQEPSPADTRPEKANETRTGRCEHERAKKAKTGSCKVCPPVAAK